MPKISVIIPVYGVEKYIERCARSLFEQTLDSIEYLFVDDDTQDNSIAILRQVLEDYPLRKSQVLIHKMEKNSGQAAVRKWGIQNATGEYIIHCDSDDWVNANMYKDMYDKACNDDADVVICDYYKTDGNNYNHIVKACHSTNRSTFIDYLLCQIDPWALWNKLFRRGCVPTDMIYPNGNMAEDMVICSQQILQCNKISYIPKPYYYYYSNPKGITKHLTIDSILRNFIAVKNNTDVVLNIYSKDNKHNVGLLYIQYNAKSYLFPIIHFKEYRGVFLKTYPTLFREMLFDFHFPIKYKIKYLVSLIGLYPRKIYK